MTGTTAGSGALTTRERGQWFLHQIGGAGVVNLGFSLRFGEQLRWWPLQEALNLLLRRHEALRQTFPAVGGIPVRRIQPPEDAEVPLAVLRGTDDSREQTLADLVAVPFDLATGPLLRATHLLVDDSSVLLVVAHHLVIDAFATSVLAEEFTRCYSQLAAGTPVDADLLRPAPLVRDPAPSPEQVEAWAHRLAGAPVSEPVAGGRAVVGVPTFAGGHASLAMPEPVREWAAELRQELKVTDGILLLALCATLLHRHGAGDDLVLGVPVNLRRGAGSARTVGFHISTVPVRLRFPPGVSFRDLAGQARATMLEILAGAPVSFEDILEHRGHHSGDWRVPLFRHVVNLQPMSAPGGLLPTARQSRMALHRVGSRTDLELVPDLSRAGAELQAWYSTEAHDAAEIEALLHRFAPLVEAVSADPDASLARSPVTSARDRRVLESTNATTIALPAATLLDRVGLDRAGPVDPDRPAVVRGAETWSYGRLRATADRLAARLIESGVAPGDRVAVIGQRGPALAAAVLGTWSCGAAYVPLDPALPPARAAELTSGVAAIVAPEAPPPQLAFDSTITVSDLPELPAPPELPGARPDAPAVVVYTSGTTGRPKGVVVGHRAMLNVMSHFATVLEAAPGERTLWSTTFGFDVSALELFLPLITGGTAVVATDEDRRRPATLLKLIASERVGIVQATPTLWRDLAAVVGRELDGVRVVSGGEALTGPLATRLLAAGCRLFNAYGPTETTIWSTVAEISHPVREPIPIGRPIANTTVEIRDPAGLACPPGVIGELCIGGLGLADGYLGQPDLTAERFTGSSGARRYRTGDLARWRADGVLVLHGRDDRQVKLRGARIELGAVEAVLERHREVQSAAVCVLPDAHGDGVLTGFILPARADAGSGLAERLWRFASEQLPPHELPNRLVTVSDLPLTGSGKVDYRRLAERVPAASTEPAAVEVPADPLVRGLLSIWRDLLGSPELGVEANFFLNGGHSLLAARLLIEVADRLGYDVSYEQLFAAPTVARLAELIRGDPNRSTEG